MYIVPVQAAPAPPSLPLSPVRQGSKRGREQEEVGGMRIRTAQELPGREQDELQLVGKVGGRTQHCQYHLGHSWPVFSLSWSLLTEAIAVKGLS